jgi:hypothetical protein
MNRMLQVAIALLLVAALPASLASAGLVRALTHSDDDWYCCCPSPDECRCTANCCSHGPAAGRTEDLTSGPVLKASVSCRFPTLPDTSLARATGSDLASMTSIGVTDNAALTDSAGRLIELIGVCRYESLHSTTSPRAPPPVLPAGC